MTRQGQDRTLGNEHDCAAGGLDLLLGDLGDELRLDDDGLVGKHTLAEHLEVAELRDVQHRGLVSSALRHLLGRHHRPEHLHVHRRAVEPVAQLVEVAHTDLAEVPGMVLVEEDAVVVHASGVTATSRMLAVLAHTPVPGRHVAALLAVLLEARRHGRRGLTWEGLGVGRRLLLPDAAKLSSPTPCPSRKPLVDACSHPTPAAESALALSSARGGGVGALALSSARGGGIGAAISSARGGGVGALPPALGSGRPFSSSSWFEPGGSKKFKPSEGLMVFCGVLSGFTGVCYCVGAGYDLLISKTTERTVSYVEAKLVEFKGFQNIATGTHHEFVRKFNEAIHAMQKEMSDLRSRILALEQKNFDQRKELMIAAELLRRHEADAGAAAAAAKDGGK